MLLQVVEALVSRSKRNDVKSHGLNQLFHEFAQKGFVFEDQDVGGKSDRCVHVDMSSAQALYPKEAIDGGLLTWA
jgi:hypothetical protein